MSKLSRNCLNLGSDTNLCWYHIPLSLRLSYTYALIPTCHAPNPGPTRLTDPNRFPGCETQDWDSLPDFFLNRTGTCGYGPHLITESQYHIHLPSPIYIFKTELLHLQIRARNLHVVNLYKCVGLAVCGCLLMSSPVPTRIKNPC